MSWPEAFASAIGFLSVAAVLIAIAIGEEIVQAWRERRRK